MAVAINKAKAFLTGEALQSQLKLACRGAMKPDRIARIVLTSVTRSKQLGECFLTPVGQQSVALALLTCTQRGLEPDGRQAHIVPFRAKQPDGSFAMTAQFIPGYQGLIDLAYNHPKVLSIQPEVVYERDTFRNLKGSDGRLEHVPFEGGDDGTESPGRLKYVYAVCSLHGGGKVWVVLNRGDIAKIRNFSKGASSASSPWTTSEEAMWKKSAIRALCKIIPQSAELRDALNDDDVAGEGLSGLNEIKQAKVTSVVDAGDPLTAASGEAGDPSI